MDFIYMLIKCDEKHILLEGSFDLMMNSLINQQNSLLQNLWQKCL
jgi:hypothetical protein